MEDVELLLDSNIYFRFAKSVHPLLPGHYKIDTTLYSFSVIDELDKEYNRNKDLGKKFPWVSERKYIRNRKEYTVDLSVLDHR